MGEHKRKEYIEQAARTLQPQFYAALALALHRKKGYGTKRILGIFEETYDIWNEYAYNAERLMRDCRDETGIICK